MSPAARDSPPVRETCGTCFFWRATTAPHGECRHDTPKIGRGPGGAYAGVWPPTRASDWCGQWTQRPGSR